MIHAADEKPKLKIGLIGCGGRGSWIIDLFDKHGGYKVVAAADYFQDRVDKVGGEVSALTRSTATPAWAVTAACWSRIWTASSSRRLLIFIRNKRPPPLRRASMSTWPNRWPSTCPAARASAKAAEKRPRTSAVSWSIFRPAPTRLPGGGPAGPSGRDRRHRERGDQLPNQHHVRQPRCPYSAHIPDDRELRLAPGPLDRALSGDVITEQNIHALDVASWFMNCDRSAPMARAAARAISLGIAGTILRWSFTIPTTSPSAFARSRWGLAMTISCAVFTA